VHARSALTITSTQLSLPIVLAFWLTLICPGAGAQEVIANDDLQCGALTQNQARLFFTMRLQACPDGDPVKVFVLPDDNSLHADFSKVVLGLFPYQLRQVWDRQVYSGTGQAPTTVRDEQEMIERVATTPGAIGYARSRPRRSGIKLLEVR
jgi:hypothetical protein